MSARRIVELEVAYDVEAIQKGRSRAQTLTVKETLPFSVRQISEGDLSPGIIIRDDSVAMCSEYPLVGGLLHRKTSPQPYVSRKVPPVGEVQFREVISHTRDAAVAKIQTWLDRGALLEGDFFTPTLGPVLVVQAHGSLERPRLTPAETVGTPAYAVGVEGNVPAFLEALGIRSESARAAVAKVLSGVDIREPGCTDPKGFDDLTTVKTARRVFEQPPQGMRLLNYPTGFLEGWLAYHEEDLDRENASEALADALRLAGMGRNSLGPYTGLKDEEKRLVDLMREAHVAWAKHAAWPSAPPPPAP